MSGGYVVTVTRRVGDVDSQGICEPNAVAVVSRQEVDTLGGEFGVWELCDTLVRERAGDAIQADPVQGSGCPTYHGLDADEWQRALRRAVYVPEAGDLFVLPDGSTITVERKDGEGR